MTHDKLTTLSLRPNKGLSHMNETLLRGLLHRRYFSPVQVTCDLLYIRNHVISMYTYTAYTRLSSSAQLPLTQKMKEKSKILLH